MTRAPLPLHDLWTRNQLQRAKLADLKQYLKEVKLPMAGELRDVAHRVKLHMDVVHEQLTVHVDGTSVSPFDLKPAQLRKQVALLGKDPQGNKDELLTLLIEHLQSTSTSSMPSRSDDLKATPGVKQAKAILELAATDDYSAILSASGIDVQPSSSTAIMRKAYLKLSLLVHPDKLPKDFADATRAFQALVTAYEMMSQPPELITAVPAKAKHGTMEIMRSNEGCHRTPVHCPRCHEAWGLPSHGCEPFDFNFLMMGLKTFHCATCLFEFGCMSAEHHCPHCHRRVEYHPNDFHRHLTCASCSKTYGFYMYKISNRREQEYRAAIRATQESKLKDKARKDERTKRASGRQIKSDDMGSTQGKETLFAMNLLDACPRCGDDDVDPTEDSRMSHLRTENQDEVQNAASWEFLGGKSSDMWLLTATQLQHMAKGYELDATGTREELIGRLVRYRNTLDAKNMLGNGGSSNAATNKRKRGPVSLEDLPKNMESMSVAQLKGVCAAFGIACSKRTKQGIIDAIEQAVLGKEAPLRLAGVILAEIARYAPDIICLEELDHFDWMQDQLDRLGYSGHFAAKRESPCLECSDLPDGCAIFVNRLKHLHIKHMCAPRYEHDDGSGAVLPSNQLALVAHVLQNEQSLVVVACTHLKSTKSHEGEVIRLSQAKQLHAHVLRHGGADIPTIICGDFNATPDDNDKYAAQAIPAMLDLGWTSAYAQAGSTPNYTTWKTRPGVESKHVIDYIFHNDKVQLLRVVDAPEDVEPSGLPSLRYPSDHIALIATFQIT
ncbi:hypothetical protein DYB31_013716, partial [Aphanomyces astaci]